TGQLRNFVAVEGVEVTAVCDIVQEKVERAGQIAVKAGQEKAPEMYWKGDHAYEQLNRREDVDMLVIATPWNWHAPMSIDAMKQGKHTTIEVPAALTIDECWALVDTSEQTRKHCVMLENCCYGYNEMLVLNLVRDGVLGEITHGAAAYNHDLRSILFSNNG